MCFLLSWEACYETIIIRRIKLILSNIVSICFIVFILLFFFFFRPNNSWHYLYINDIQNFHKAIILVSLVFTILLTVIPMSLSPYWNGTMVFKADKQQYDRMGDALLQGRLYIDNNDIDPALEAMDNPYDGFERQRLGVRFNWDEAYYNHHYYMYFGVVPTILLFIPFKLITGQALQCYQATQFFAALTIIGIFYLFYIMCQYLFPCFPFSQYIVLSSAFSLLCIGYSISAPALYCTAIVSGVCLMVWSIICFLKGVWIEKYNNSGTIYLFFGSLLGALVFGCRPPVALANIVVVAVLYQLFKDKGGTSDRMVKEVVYVITPYFVVGVFLMLYNYVRFDNVFEFGQSYQLTVTDQHSYGNVLARLDLKLLFSGMLSSLYGSTVPLDSFPFLVFNGAFVNFPILILSIRIFSLDIARILKTKKIYLVSVLMFLVTFIIALLDVYWTPFLLERYHLDFYYLLCIVSFVTIAAWLEINLFNNKKKKIILCILTVLAFAVFVVEFLLFCVPFDYNYTYWHPEILDEIYRGLRFGI